ncbi:hypothetical protein PS914_02442 [Pseudomonas fluorescens]|nr:hypothetical protein PS914_02442 [Pseudomonas fluorescens]
MMNKEIERKIMALRGQLDEADMFLGMPAQVEDLRVLVETSKNIFSHAVPEQYLELLKFHDGLVSSGVFIYSSRPHKYSDSDGFSHDFIGQNLIARELEFMSAFLIFGESDQDEYVLDIKNNIYQVRDKQAIDNVFEEFDTFDGLLNFMLDLIIERI